MGEVYLARHPRLPRQDALKLLNASISSDLNFSARFLREADLAARLWHPNIVGVHDRGEDDGRLWIAMDFVDGTDAAELMSRKFPVMMFSGRGPEVVTPKFPGRSCAFQRTCRASGRRPTT
jgi:serine/threonine protein kinase